MLTGAKIGQYVLDEHILKKGVADIWSAFIQKRTGYKKKVVLKIISDSSHFETFAPELAAEADIINSLSHPNIVKFHEFGHSTEGIPFLVTEFTYGRSLQSVRKQCVGLNRTVPVWLIVSVVAAYCSALQYAFENIGYIHHEVCPSNLLLCFTGESKVREFGALGTKSVSRFTAPETKLNVPIDVRSNIYSLGMILNSLTIGQAPNVHTVTTENSSQTITPQFRKVIAKSMHASSHSRYQSFDAFRTALMQINADLAPSQSDIAKFLEALFSKDDVPEYVRRQRRKTITYIEGLGVDSPVLNAEGVEEQYQLEVDGQLQALDDTEEHMLELTDLTEQTEHPSPEALPSEPRLASLEEKQEIMEPIFGEVPREKSDPRRIWNPSKEPLETQQAEKSKEETQPKRKHSVFSKLTSRESLGNGGKVFGDSPPQTKSWPWKGSKH